LLIPRSLTGATAFVLLPSPLYLTVVDIVPDALVLQDIWA
jgi:hypothetical protein